jgi:hypothetical protein
MATTTSPHDVVTRPDDSSRSHSSGEATFPDMTDPASLRRAPRVSTLIRATIAREGEPGHEAIVRDVSPGGLCIASRAVSVEEGDLITVALPGSSGLEARVCWIGDGEFGVQITSGLNAVMMQPVRSAAPEPACPTAMRRWLSGWRDAFGGKPPVARDTEAEQDIEQDAKPG